MARKKKKRDIGNPKLLYLACKQWRDDDSTGPTLAEVWHNAVQQDDLGNGRRLRKYILRNYELELQYPD